MVVFQQVKSSYILADDRYLIFVISSIFLTNQELTYSDVDSDVDSNCRFLIFYPHVFLYVCESML